MKRSPLRRKKRGFDLEIRDAVFDRDNYACQAPADWGSHFGVLTPHHLLKASQGGKYTTENLITLCAYHNEYVEDYPQAAEKAHLVIKSWEAR